MSSTPQPLVSSLPSMHLHGGRIASVAYVANRLLLAKQSHQTTPTLTKKERQMLAAQIKALESPYLRGSINFSRAQVRQILTSRDRGERIEFETWGPYLADYAGTNGVMSLSNLLPEDVIGLELARTLRAIFPQARPVSLYDEYNTNKNRGDSKNTPFSKEMKSHFKQSLAQLLTNAGILTPQAVEGRDYSLLAESQLVADAKKMVGLLEERNLIRRQGQEILFVNEASENPLHRQFYLRYKTGKWSCAALDAAGFQDPINLTITHIIILPDYMRDQQDQVWEILRVLGMRPERYHNLFFDPKASIGHITQMVRDIFLQAG